VRRPRVTGEPTTEQLQIAALKEHQGFVALAEIAIEDANSKITSCTRAMFQQHDSQPADQRAIDFARGFNAAVMWMCNYPTKQEAAIREAKEAVSV